ncbi:hypothetical protein [Streptomyces sp. NPDC058671]
MAKTKVTAQETKPAVRKPSAQDVAKLQARVAAQVGNGELMAAPVSYHH